MNTQWESRHDFMADKEDDSVHIYPIYGKAHIASDECWCEPVRDYEFINLLIHRPSH